MPAAGAQQQPTTFDFNSFQTPAEKRAEPMRQTGAYAAQAPQSQTLSQYKAGIKFGGF